jgi:heme-degrading monooxygenase HmoA
MASSRTAWAARKVTALAWVGVSPHTSSSARKASQPMTSVSAETRSAYAPRPRPARQGSTAHSSRYFIARPGFVSLRLHRAVNDDAPYRWVNVAVWESEAAFRAAHGTEQFRTLATAQGWSEFPSLPALFEVDTEVG